MRYNSFRNNVCHVLYMQQITGLYNGKYCSFWLSRQGALIQCTGSPHLSPRKRKKMAVSITSVQITYSKYIIQTIFFSFHVSCPFIWLIWAIWETKTEIMSEKMCTVFMKRKEQTYDSNNTFWRENFRQHLFILGKTHTFLEFLIFPIYH